MTPATIQMSPAQRVAVGRAVAWAMAELGCGTREIVEDAWVSLSSLEAILDGRQDASRQHMDRVLVYLGLDIAELLEQAQ